MEEEELREKEIVLENFCYVLLKTEKIHPLAYRRSEMIWYPETAMSLIDCVQYKPYLRSIVTENPWLISCYKQDHVRIFSKYGWIRPDFQTFGTSVNKILLRLLGIRQTIPSYAYDGGKQIKELIERIDNL